MKLVVNGSVEEFEKALNLIDLIEHFELSDRRIAVMLNDEIIKKENKYYSGTRSLI